MRLREGRRGADAAHFSLREGKKTNYLHWDFNAGSAHVIRLDLKSAANVVLLDDINYSAFRRGASHRYFGGHYRQTPVRLSPPHSGHWHVIVHLGGYAGRVVASVAIA